MHGEYNKHCGLLVSAHLKTKKRREGEAVQAFEQIIGRSVPSPSSAKIKKPKFDRLRSYEIVLWEATEP